MAEKKTGLKYAFLKTVPVLFGYVFLGTAFGILLRQAGYGVLWALGISLFVYAGSMQFVLVSLLSGGAGLLTAAVTTLFINSRHLFYGLSFVDRFRAMKKTRPYMIFSLTDETYSVFCAMEGETPRPPGREYFRISLMDHCYWVAGSVIGSLAGGLIPFDFTGIDFSMTALFVVIFIDQLRGGGKWFPAAVGFMSAALFLLLMGPDAFLLPALVVTVLVLSVTQRAKRGRE